MSRRGVAWLGTALLLATGCSAGAENPAPTPPPAAGSPTHAAAPELPVDDPSLDVALSEPREDSVYPQVGDPSVDALHYNLDLHWTPTTDTLDGLETLTFRSTATAEEFQLDLGRSLEVDAVTLNGEGVDFDHTGKDLVVRQPVTEDQRYVLEIAYSGTPRPAAAPTTRSDFNTVGWTITDTHETWTMQEPFGAYTWYAVNDHPSDKALYDFRITVPAPWVGVANGVLESRATRDGATTTQWHLAEPAASYLTTVAIGDFRMATEESASGVPITLWVPRSRPELIEGLRAAGPGIDWLEEKLGPYPFDSAGIVLVDSTSGMETQTMITLGMTDYTQSAAVIVHELAHQWYGDQVTPDDWRDMWMNEGMAMYLQGLWQADDEGLSDDDVMDYWATFEPEMRAESGPPAAYEPEDFGSSNVYYGPALMWHELRQRIGDKAFFELIRAWPAAYDNDNAGRSDYLPWLEEQTGVELSAFFDAWLLGKTSPSRRP